jgi:DNA replication protein DnaC
MALETLEARLENLLEQASKKAPSYADFLDELLSCEVEAWNAGVVICARPRLAHFTFVKTFEQFDFGFQPALDERQIRELRSLRSSSDTLRSRSLPRLRYCRRAKNAPHHGIVRRVPAVRTVPFWSAGWQVPR